MLGVGVATLIANVTCLALLAKHRKGEVHMRASWIFSKNDVIANTGIILASALVHFGGTRWPDLAIGLLTTVVVFPGCIAILMGGCGSGE